MSTPPAAAPSDGERRKSLGRYVKRMSSVFKREKSSKSIPQSSSAGAAPVESEAQQPPQLEVPSADVPRVEDATQDAAQQPAKAESIREQHPTEDVAAPTDLTPTTSLTSPAPVQLPPSLDRNAMQQERARALFAKYGLTLESHEWITASPAPLVPRVEKAIRMRVHRSCHRCGTLYGHDKVCLQCEHKRCKKCPRYPKKKTDTTQTKDKAVVEPQKKKVLTLTTRSGNQRAYLPPTQRIRRTCHKCSTLFIPPTALTCPSCAHPRCTKCPREPAKRAKWPTGYPGDVEAESEDEEPQQVEQFRRIWRKPRRIVRWECEVCGGLFRQGMPVCGGCGHERCERCLRSPVKKARHEETFDPAVVAAVEAKLAALGVDDDTLTSGAEHT